jgi:hypothetical protein
MAASTTTIFRRSNSRPRARATLALGLAKPKKSQDNEYHDHESDDINNLIHRVPLIVPLKAISHANFSPANDQVDCRRDHRLRQAENN